MDSSTVMLDEFICHFRGVGSISSLLFYFFMETVDPDQMPHYVASDLGLHCLPMARLRVSRQEWVIHNSYLILRRQRKANPAYGNTLYSFA